MSDQKQFAGRAAIVTGATRGIGRAIALELARRGADIAFNYAKSAEAAESLKSEIEALGVRALATQGDVANTDAAAEMVKQAKDAFGRIDFLVNNAGIVRDTLILRMKEDDWDAVIDTNLRGAWNFSKAALRVMLRQEEGASILNITSISGVVGMAGQSNYSASKAGMIGLTKALAREVATRKVTVNALALGMVATDMASVPGAIATGSGGPGSATRSLPPPGTDIMSFRFHVCPPRSFLPRCSFTLEARTQSEMART
jgi:3-oxoacyl-[acyl-carrier protein] reductase